MAITYTQTRLKIKCYPDELVVGKREARDAILWTQEYFDELPEVESESIPAVLYGEGEVLADRETEYTAKSGWYTAWESDIM